MSHLTDNYFYPSAERIWLCLRLNNASLNGPAVDLQKIGFWFRGITEPFFFENQQGEAVTVNGDRYGVNFFNSFNKFLLTKIEEEDIGNIWFEQDAATCHTAEATLDVLLPVFEDHRQS